MRKADLLRLLSLLVTVSLAQFVWDSPAHAAVVNYLTPNQSYPGLQLWLDASTLPGSTTSVSLWQDSSPTGSDVSQGTASAQPTYVSSNGTFNTWPTVHFDGGDVLNTSALTSALGIDGSSPRTVFVMFKQDAAESKNVMGFGTNAPLELNDILISSSKIVGHFYGAGNDTIGGTTQTMSAGERIVAALRFDGTNVDLFQHDSSVNTMIASQPHALSTGISTISIGAGKYTPLNSFTGDIAEVLIYNEALSDLDVAAVDNYLYTKYSVTPTQWAILSTPPVPEPGTGLLLILGVCCGSKFRRRKRTV